MVRRELTDVSVPILQQALSELSNVGKVDVSQTNEDHVTNWHFLVTFQDVFGEYLLLTASDPSIAISRNEGRFSATEIQTVTMSVDKTFIYEVQSISVLSSSASSYLFFTTGQEVIQFRATFLKS